MTARFVFLLLVLCCALPVGAQSTDLAPEQIDAITRSVVLVTDADSDRITSWGSGTLVSPTGLIYTNRHVVENARNLLIYTLSDVGELPQPTYTAYIVEIFADIDFAVLQIDRDAFGNPIDPNTLNLPYIARVSTEVNIGETIYVFGYPATTGEGYIITTRGTISGVQNETVNGQRIPYWYRTDAQVSGGNSGGLAVDSDGAFIGIPTQARAGDRGFGSLGLLLSLRAIHSVTTPGTYLIDDGSLVVFTVSNYGTEALCGVYLNESINQLDVGDSIAPSDSRSWETPRGVYDVRLENCTGATLMTTTLDLSAATTLPYAPAVQNGQPPIPEPRTQTSGQSSGRVSLLVILAFGAAIAVFIVGGGTMAALMFTRQKPKPRRRSNGNSGKSSSALPPVITAPPPAFILLDGQRIPIALPEFTIGRQVGLLKLNDLSVSRQHARITFAPPHYFIEDVGSSGGTRVNGQPIRGAHPLTPGDHIQVGQILLVFEVSQ